MLKSVLAFSLLFLFAKSSFSQADNFFSLYQYNANILNPAYAGSHKNLDVGIMRTWDYVHLFDFESIDGAPRFFTANAHAPIGEKFGAGFSYESGKIGALKEKDISLDISYKLFQTEGSILSFGIKGGYNYLNLEGLFNNLIDNDGDILFNNNEQNFKLKNVGSGIYYHTNKFYAGLAYTYYFGNYLNIVGNTLVEDNNYKESILNGSAGYVFDLSENVKLKPSLIAFYNSTIEETWFYVSGNLYFDKVLELGVHYNISKAIAFSLSSPEILKTFKIGLNVDVLEKNSLNYSDNYSYQNITLFTNFNIDAFGNKQSPIYF